MKTWRKNGRLFSVVGRSETAFVFQRNAGSRRLELMTHAPTTLGSHSEEQRGPEGRNPCCWTLEPSIPISRNCVFPSVENLHFPTLELRFPLLWVPEGWNPCVPMLERFQFWETTSSQPFKPMFPNLGSTPFRGTAGSLRLEPMFPNLGTKGSRVEELQV